MNKMLRYTPYLAKDLKNEGDGLEGYQSLLSILAEEIKYCKQDLEFDEERRNDNERWPEYEGMTDDEKSEKREFLEEAQELYDDISEIVQDELNHSAKLTARLAKWSKIRPAQDGMSENIKLLVGEEKPNDDND